LYDYLNTPEIAKTRSSMVSTLAQTDKIQLNKLAATGSSTLSSIVLSNNTIVHSLTSGWSIELAPELLNADTVSQQQYLNTTLLVSSWKYDVF